MDWTNVGRRGGVAEIGSDGSNNGLQRLVEVLEAIYTDKNFPLEAIHTLPYAPIDLNISRADLWAFAAMVAVEVSMDWNNAACANPRAPPTAGQAVPPMARKGLVDLRGCSGGIAGRCIRTWGT